MLMVLKRRLLLVLVGLLTIVVWLASGAVADRPDATAVLRDATGRTVASVSLATQADGSVRVQVLASRLAAGFHGFHVHAVGLCDPNAVDPATGQVNPFISAGGHFDPAGRGHGQHSGDLPSLLAGADGVGGATVRADRFDVAELFDGDGSAIIIHALPDNFAHIPTRYSHPADETGTTGPDAATLRTGDAGGRFACGVVRRG